MSTEHNVSNSEHNVTTSAFSLNADDSAFLQAGGATISMSPGFLMLDNGGGASICLCGPSIFINAGGPLIQTAPVIALN